MIRMCKGMGMSNGTARAIVSHSNRRRDRGSPPYDIYRARGTKSFAVLYTSYIRARTRANAI